MINIFTILISDEAGNFGSFIGGVFSIVAFIVALVSFIFWFYDRSVNKIIDIKTELYKRVKRHEFFSRIEISSIKHKSPVFSGKLLKKILEDYSNCQEYFNSSEIKESFLQTALNFIERKDLKNRTDASAILDFIQNDKLLPFYKYIKYLEISNWLLFLISFFPMQLILFNFISNASIFFLKKEKDKCDIKNKNLRKLVFEIIPKNINLYNEIYSPNSYNIYLLYFGENIISIDQSIIDENEINKIRSTKWMTGFYYEFMRWCKYNRNKIAIKNDLDFLKPVAFYKDITETFMEHITNASQVENREKLKKTMKNLYVINDLDLFNKILNRI
jgi:hypothetical protein